MKYAGALRDFLNVHSGRLTTAKIDREIIRLHEAAGEKAILSPDTVIIDLQSVSTELEKAILHDFVNGQHSHNVVIALQDKYWDLLGKKSVIPVLRNLLDRVSTRPYEWIQLYDSVELGHGPLHILFSGNGEVAKELHLLMSDLACEHLPVTPPGDEVKGTVSKSKASDKQLVNLKDMLYPQTVEDYFNLFKIKLCLEDIKHYNEVIKASGDFLGMIKDDEIRTKTRYAIVPIINLFPNPGIPAKGKRRRANKILAVKS